MDRKAIKEEAKAKIKGNLWTIWKVLLIVIVISTAADLIISALFPVSYDTMQTFLETGTMPLNKAGEAAKLVISIVLAPLTIGCAAYILKFVRGKKPEVNEIFGHYKNILTIALVTILVYVFISIGMVLLIIPGIIIALMLSMYTYILADGETDIWETIKQSANMMKGHKWEYFVFLLSFIGWILLCFITLGIAAIYVVPYMNTASCIWYDNLKELNKPAKIVEPKEEKKSEEPKKVLNKKTSKPKKVAKKTKNK